MGCAGEAESVVIYGVSQFVDHSSISQSNEATLSTPECSQIAVTPPPPPTRTRTWIVGFRQDEKWAESEDGATMELVVMTREFQAVSISDRV